MGCSASSPKFAEAQYPAVDEEIERPGSDGESVDSPRSGHFTAMDGTDAGALTDGSLGSDGFEVMLSSNSEHGGHGVDSYPVLAPGKKKDRKKSEKGGVRRNRKGEPSSGGAEPPSPPVKSGKGGRTRKAVFARGFSTKDTKTSAPKSKTLKTDRQMDFLLDVLSTCYLFSDMEAADMEELAQYMWREKIKVGKEVVTQGKTSDTFYIVEKGTFQVKRGSGSKAKVSQVSGGGGEGGACFGESALLFSASASASIKCIAAFNNDNSEDKNNRKSSGGKKHAEVWAIDRSTYKHVVAQRRLLNRDEFRGAVESISMLADNLSAQQLDKLVDAIEVLQVKAGHRVIKKGDHGHVLYFIKSGSVTCSNIGKDGLGQIALGAGSYFGERALLTDEPRAADVVTDSDCTLLCLAKHSFDELLGPLRDVLDENMKSRVVEAVPVLQELSHSNRRKITAQFETRTFKAGEPIVREGDEGDRFYIIRSGIVEVRSKEMADGENRGSNANSPLPPSSKGHEAKYGPLIVTLKEGEWFGEMALLNDEPRSATVVAQGAVECFTLSFDAFKQLSTQSNMLRSTSDERRADNISKRGSFGRPNGSAASSKSSSSCPPAGVISESFKKLKISELKRTKILGKGTFGTVFLVEAGSSAPVSGVWALKMMSKEHIVKCEQTRNVNNEKEALLKLQAHPFILKLYTTFQDKDFLFMLLEFVQGGELFSVMQLHYRLPLPHAQFYAACIVDALDFMHGLEYVYRDLKPENVLIDSDGFIKLADFGFAKKVSGKTFTLCGTPEYLAPEIITSKGHNKGVDYWAVGVLIYEMLVGISPYADEYKEDQLVVCKQIVRNKVNYDRLESAVRELQISPPSSLTERELAYKFGPLKESGKKAKEGGGRRSSGTAFKRLSITGGSASSSMRPVEDLIRKLLVKSPHQRLGCLKDGAGDIKSHAFFGINASSWSDLRARRWPTPYKPVITSKTDTSNFDEFQPDDHFMKTRYKGSNDWCKEF